MTTRSIGLVYDLLGTAPAAPGAPPDADAEYEPEDTIVLLEDAIQRAGHRPVRLGSPHDLLRAAAKGALGGIEAALNIAEGYGGRNREAWAPVLLEMAEIQSLGSDALTLSLSLDKAWTHAVASAAGVPVPAHVVVAARAELGDADLPGFPLFVKPRWEGTAKGIHPGSRVEDAASLEREVARIAEVYHQPALVEAFLPGAEYTVSLIGNDPPQVLPVLQRALEKETGIGLHALERHAECGGLEHVTPGELDLDLEARLGEQAVAVFRALDCRDFARADFRLAADGTPTFLEINPLPTFARDGSFGILAELAGRDVEDLVADVLTLGLRRLGL